MGVSVDGRGWIAEGCVNVAFVVGILQGANPSNCVKTTYHQVPLRLAIGLDDVVKHVVPILRLGLEQLALYACGMKETASERSEEQVSPRSITTSRTHATALTISPCPFLSRHYPCNAPRPAGTIVLATSRMVPKEPSVAKSGCTGV